MITLAETPAPSHVPTNRETVLWTSTAHLFRERLFNLGAAGTHVWVWSFKDSTERKDVLLDHEVYAHVTLSVEQFNLLVAHLPSQTNSEQLFLIAQAIEQGDDLPKLYDDAGRLRVPRARRKVGVS